MLEVHESLSLRSCYWERGRLCNKGDAPYYTTGRNYFKSFRFRQSDMGQKSKLIIAKQKLLTSRLVYSSHRVGLEQPQVTCSSLKATKLRVQQIRRKGKGARFLACYSRTS